MMNFIKHVMQQLDDQTLGLLGAVLGENESKVRDGVKSAVPKILGAMVSAAKVEEGQDMLWRELRDTDATVANNFSQQLHYKDSQSLVANGHDQLDGLIGAETNRLIQSVGRESDLGSTSAKRLVGAVTPLVFATVANHQQSRRLDQNELGAVISQQKNFLSDWERQSNQHFPGASNDNDRNEPLFSGLPPNAGGAPVIATAVGSASLGMHHFRAKDQDQQSDTPNKEDAAAAKDFDPTADKKPDPQNRGRAAAYGSGSQSRLKKANEKDLADTPGGVELSESGKDLDQPSKSAVAGTIAAAGAGVAGVAAAAAALNPSAKTPTTDSSTGANRGDTASTNTYDSKNAVSGFAAATPSTPGQTEGSGGNTGSGSDTSGKRFWTPDAANAQRDADGTLRYSDPDVATGNMSNTGGSNTGASATGGSNTASNTSSNARASNTSSTSTTRTSNTRTSTSTNVAGKKSGGWFHWLWWPVLFLGSLLALGLMFLNPGGSGWKTTGQSGDAAVAVATDGDAAVEVATDGETAVEVATDSETDTSDDDATATGLAVSDGNSDESNNGASSSETSDSDLLNSSIQISPDQPGESTEAGDPSQESGADLAAADSTSGKNVNSASKTKNADGTESNNTELAITEPMLDQDTMPSIEGNLDAREANSALQGTVASGAETSKLNASLKLDPDEQVEELLSAIETELGEVNNKAQAEAAKKSLSKQISSLEKVLADRAQWKDEIAILVDFQLEEGKKMLAKTKENLSQTKTVKNTLNGTFKKLNKLMKPATANKP